MLDIETYIYVFFSQHSATVWFAQPPLEWLELYLHLEYSSCYSTHCLPSVPSNLLPMIQTSDSNREAFLGPKPLMELYIPYNHEGGKSVILHI